MEVRDGASDGNMRQGYRDQRRNFFVE